MDECALSALKRLAQCLEDASGCINQVPDTQEVNNLRAQLQSLQLILDRNRDSLRSRLNDHEKGGHPFRMSLAALE